MHPEGAGDGGIRHVDTIILGAGLAGLACASKLLPSIPAEARAAQLQVLEARDRVGGRIGSVHVNGCRLDIGPNWIHGTGSAQLLNPIVNILPHQRYRSMRGIVLFESRGLSQDRTNPIPSTKSTNESTTFKDSSALLKDMVELIWCSVQKAISEVEEYAGQISPEEAKHLSALEVLRTRGAFQHAFDAVPQKYHSTLGAMYQCIENVEAATLLAQAAEPRCSESAAGLGLLEYAVRDYGGEHAFVQDGYDAIVHSIAQPLEAAGIIRLETIVTRVDWSSAPIVIETNRGMFTAREVVCTFPLGVLKDCHKDGLFVPELPADKQVAIQRLGFGTLDKIFAVYSRPWWHEEPYSFFIRTHSWFKSGSPEDGSPDTFVGFVPEFDSIALGSDGSDFSGAYRLYVMNLQSLTDQPVLGAFVACEAAIRIEVMSDEEVGELFHRTLSEWFGTELPRPVAVHVTRWAQDPFSRGAYSHMITGLSDREQKESLQAPIVNAKGAVLRFSGEHCSEDHFATAHGALLDGWRVAAAIKSHTQV